MKSCFLFLFPNTGCVCATVTPIIDDLNFWFITPSRKKRPAQEENKKKEKNPSQNSQTSLEEKINISNYIIPHTIIIMPFHFTSFNVISIRCEYHVQDLPAANYLQCLTLWREVLVRSFQS